MPDRRDYVYLDIMRRFIAKLSVQSEGHVDEAMMTKANNKHSDLEQRRR